MNFKVGDCVEYYDLDGAIKVGLIANIEHDVNGNMLYKLGNYMYLRSKTDIRRRLRGIIL